MMPSAHPHTVQTASTSSDTIGRLLAYHEHQHARLLYLASEAEAAGKTRTQRHRLMQARQHRLWAELVRSLLASSRTHTHTPS